MQNKNFKFIKKIANAKINLGLQILNKRNDGFHNINTIFYPINLCDKIEFLLDDKFGIITEPDSIIKNEDNLIYRVWKIFQSRFGVSPIKVTLRKNIPIGAGLGGGSSDAAKMILALDKFFALNLNDSILREIALIVGSDVPFFLDSFSVAEAKSRGEDLKYFRLDKRFKLAVINPGINISTASAYKSLNRNGEPAAIVDFKKIMLETNPMEYKNFIFNDFEKNVFTLYPEIRQIKEKLYDNGSFFALMSGSGSSVFGLFENPEELKSIKMIFPDYFVYVEN